MTMVSRLTWARAASASLHPAFSGSRWPGGVRCRSRGLTCSDCRSWCGCTGRGCRTGTYVSVTRERKGEIEDALQREVLLPLPRAGERL